MTGSGLAAGGSPVLAKYRTHLPSGVTRAFRPAHLGHERFSLVILQGLPVNPLVTSAIRHENNCLAIGRPIQHTLRTFAARKALGTQDLRPPAAKSAKYDVP